MTIIDIDNLPEAEEIKKRVEQTSIDFDITDFVSGDKINSDLLNSASILFLSEVCQILLAIYEIDTIVNKAQVTRNLLLSYGRLIPEDQSIKTFVSSPQSNIQIRTTVKNLLTRGLNNKIISLSGSEINDISKSLSTGKLDTDKHPVQSSTSDLKEIPSVDHSDTLKSPSNKSRNVGIACGVIVLLIFIVIIVLFAVRRKNKLNLLLNNA